MQSWHYYEALGILIILGNLLFMLASRTVGFEQRSNFAMGGIRLFCLVVPSVLFMALNHTGFCPADARAADHIMVADYIAQGVQTTEVGFVVNEQSTMIGFVNVPLH